MRTVSTIHPLFKDHLIATGTLPVQVLANDFENYLCKHTNQYRANSLFNEYIAAEFLHLWEIDTPEHVLVKVLPDHVTNEILGTQLSYKNFERPCLGFSYLQNAEDATRFIMGAKGNQSFTKKFLNKDDLIRIALFDIWLANEDRNLNNNNLLINPESKGYKIIPIDHENVFNSSSAKEKLSEITQEDSIIFSDIFATLITKQNSKTFVNTLQTIIEEFKDHVKRCKKHNEAILAKVPQEWNILLSEKDALLHSILSPEWTNKSINLLKQFITQHQKSKS